MTCGEESMIPGPCDPHRVCADTQEKRMKNKNVHEERVNNVGPETRRLHVSHACFGTLNGIAQRVLEANLEYALRFFICRARDDSRANPANPSRERFSGRPCRAGSDFGNSLVVHNERSSIFFFFISNLKKNPV